MKLHELSFEAQQVAYMNWKDIGNDYQFMLEFESDVVELAKELNVELFEIKISLNDVCLSLGKGETNNKILVSQKFAEMVYEVNEIFTWERFVKDCEYSDSRFTSEGTSKDWSVYHE